MLHKLLTTLLLSLTVISTATLSIGRAQQSKIGLGHHTSWDSTRTSSDQSTSTEDANASWFNYIGAELDVNTGMMARLSSGFLTAGHVGVDAGILGRRVVDFYYERPLIKTDFSSEALAYQENRSEGIEKYTFGVDIGPVFKWLIPGDIPWIFRRILSMRFRTMKELLQSNSPINENTLFVTDATELSGSQIQQSDFTDPQGNSNISIKKKYHYYSADFPLIYFNSREYDFSANADDPVHVDRLPGDQQTLLWIGTGIAKWNFIEPTQKELSELEPNNVMFSVHNEVWAANVEATFKSINMDINGKEFRFASITRAGYGFRYKVSNPHVDINKLVDISEKTEFGTGSRYLQSTVAFGMNLLSDSDVAKLYITPRATYRIITTETSATNREEEIFYFNLNMSLNI